MYIDTCVHVLSRLINMLNWVGHNVELFSETKIYIVAVIQDRALNNAGTAHIFEQYVGFGQRNKCRDKTSQNYEQNLIQLCPYHTSI